METSHLTTDIIEQQIICSDDDLLYWQQKLERCNNHQRRSYYRDKIMVAQSVNTQARNELAKRKKLSHETN